MTWRWWSIVPVWVLSAVGAAAILSTPAREHGWTWIPVGFGLSVLVAFALQLATRTPTGVVHRSVAAVLGSLVVFLVASAILAIAG